MWFQTDKSQSNSCIGVLGQITTKTEVRCHINFQDAEFHLKETPKVALNVPSLDSNYIDRKQTNKTMELNLKIELMSISDEIFHQYNETDI